MQQRTVQAVDRLVENDNGTLNIALVSHGVVTTLYLCHLKGVKLVRKRDSLGHAEEITIALRQNRNPCTAGSKLMGKIFYPSKPGNRQILSKLSAVSGLVGGRNHSTAFKKSSKLWRTAYAVASARFDKPNLSRMLLT